MFRTWHHPAVLVPLVLQFLAWPIAWLFFNVFFALRVNGLEHLHDVDAPVVFAANHTHHLDPILIRNALPWLSRLSPMFYVARKRELYRWHGWRAVVYSDAFFRAWGAYPAYAGNHDYAQSLRHFLALLQHGRTVTIFPKGMERPGHTSSSHVRGGIGFLALTTGAKVLPVAIHGMTDSQRKRRLGRKVVSVTFGEPVDPKYFARSAERPTVEECRALASTVWDAIEKLEPDSVGTTRT